MRGACSFRKWQRRSFPKRSTSDRSLFWPRSFPVQSDELALLLEDIGPHLKNCVILLACPLFRPVPNDPQGKPRAVQRGLQAVQMIKEIAPLIGGSGGGRPDSAQAGGKTPEGLESAIEKVKSLLTRVT